MKYLFPFFLQFFVFAAAAQTNTNTDAINVRKSLTLNQATVSDISRDSTNRFGSDNKLMTERAIKAMIRANSGTAADSGLVNENGTIKVDYRFLSVKEITGYKGKSSVIEVLDSLRGGRFVRYNGPDSADNGMIFADALGRKWLRHTDGNRLNIYWYGIYPYNNYKNDDVPVIKSALRYIQKHASKFSVLYFPRGTDGNNSWYLIGSTLVLQNVEITGDGLHEFPLTKFQVLPDIKAFFIPARDYLGGANHVNVSNIEVTHYDPLTKARNNHTFDIRCFVNFTNVSVNRNLNGNGFNIIACGGAKDETYGNADHSNFYHCQANQCENGMFISGCDANIITIHNCSFVSNRFWGVYDDGLLGNLYHNPHFSNNGKQGECIATYNDKFYVSMDVPDNTGKRPDISPAYWYPVTAMGGANPWDQKKHYYSGGTLMVRNENAFTKVIAPYSESFQPPMQLNLRSTSEGGDNDAGVRGGLNIHPVGGILFVDNDQHNGGIVTDRISAGPTPAGHYAVYGNSADYYAALFQSSGRNSVVMHLQHNASNAKAGIQYADSTLSFISNDQYTVAAAPSVFWPYNTDNKIDLGKNSNRWRSAYISNIYTEKTGIGTNKPQGILDVVSTTTGALPFPRMTQAQKTAMMSPVIGMHIYQTDGKEGVYVYKSTGWVFAY